jgi:hypothetical protein
MVSPQYVAAEFAFRIMSQSRLSALEVAARNEDVALFIKDILEDPKSIDMSRVRSVVPILQAEIAKQIASNRYVLSEDELILNTEEESN